MLKFFKMHGIGNDYIYIDQIEIEQELDFQKFAKYASRRCYGIGGDGVIVLRKSKVADAKMLIYNSDGSMAKMCGNATRCSAFYLSKKLKRNKIKLQVQNQIVNCNIMWSNSKRAKVEAILKKPKIVQTICRQIKDKVYRINIVDVGNLHAVIFIDNFNFGVCEIGELVNNLKDFKEGINVEFVKVVSENKIKIKVFERGSGLTKACGSGACASAYVYYRMTHKKQNKIFVVLEGGKLDIEIKTKKIKMIGNAEFVYKGEI